MTDLRRKSDPERLAVTEVRLDSHESLLTEIKRDVRGVLRNQWIQSGILAFVMVLLKYPQIAQLFIDSGSAVAGVVK